MKIGRIISVKSRKLSSVRNNFRKIFLLAIVCNQDRLHSKERNIYFDQDGNYRSSEKLTVLEKSNLADFQDKWWRLERLKRKSICFCSICNKVDSDMAYLSPSDGWVCIKCYQTHHKKVLT